MVDDHLVPREIHTVGHPDHNLKWLHSIQKTSCDHLVAHEYVPLDIMKEIVEMWYELSTFIVLGFLLGRGSNPKCALVACYFLLQDRWGLNIDVRQHVKHIYIRLEYIEGVDDNVTQLDANLRRRSSLGANARVVLQLQCTYVPSSTLTELQVSILVGKFHMVFSVLKKLVKEGKRVMVNVKGYHVFEVKVERLNAPSSISKLTKVLSDKDLLVLQP